LFATVQANGTTAAGQNENFRCDLEIAVLSHPIPGSGGGEELTGGANGTSTDHDAMRFKVYNAWITSIAYSDLNAGDNAILVEQMTLVHEGFDVNWAPDLTTKAPAFR
jgi:phage tail-like protein